MKRDKEEFRKTARDTIERLGIKTTTSIDHGESSVIVCARVSSFDPESNELWDHEDNKSYPRDIECFFCYNKIVMSGGMFRMYKEAKVRPRVCCADCAFTSLAKK